MSEAGDGTVELLAPVLCRCCGAAQQPALRPQNNVKRDASRRARLAVWCSSLIRESPAGTGKDLKPNRPGSDHVALGDTKKRRVG